MSASLWTHERQSLLPRIGRAQLDATRLALTVRHTLIPLYTETRKKSLRSHRNRYSALVLAHSSLDARAESSVGKLPHGCQTVQRRDQLSQRKRSGGHVPAMTRRAASAEGPDPKVAVPNPWAFERIAFPIASQHASARHYGWTPAALLRP
jgi:hypothetical protein